jgi:Fe-S cluster assembly ATP-binding protein
MADLEIRDLHVRTAEREILRGVDLDVARGEIHALMGPNGSGKSTLAHAILGHPGYEVTSGRILFGGADVTRAEPFERARAGLFLAFQYPVAIPGVTLRSLLRMAVAAARPEPLSDEAFEAELRAAAELLGVRPEFLDRHVNDGLSGGEKKRCEMLQLALLAPRVAVLDETDSGLDIDALRTVADGIAALNRERGTGFLVITHYQRILDLVTPDHVHVLIEGRVARRGGSELVGQLEAEGYDWVRRQAA